MFVCCLAPDGAIQGRLGTVDSLFLGSIEYIVRLEVMYCFRRLENLLVFEIKGVPRCTDALFHKNLPLPTPACTNRSLGQKQTVVDIMSNDPCHRVRYHAIGKVSDLDPRIQFTRLLQVRSVEDPL